MKRFLQPTVECDLNAININQFASTKALQKAFAKNYGVSQEHLELFNGCDNVIETFFSRVVHQKKIRKCYIYAPCYSYYAQMAKIFCEQVVLINRFESLTFPIEVNAVVIFTNPSKPDGYYYELQSLVQYWQEQKATVFLDEAFLDFTNYKSASIYLNDHEDLYILKSMQRFFNTKGLKASALLTNKKNIQKLQKSLPKYRLSAFDTHYLQEAFLDKQFKPIYQAITIKNMMLLQEVLECTGLFEKIYASHTNMLLCKLHTMDAQTFIYSFKKAHIYMKTCAHFKFLDKYHVRFTVYSEEDIKSLITIFQTIYTKTDK